MLTTLKCLAHLPEPRNKPIRIGKKASVFLLLFNRKISEDLIFLHLLWLQPHQLSPPPPPLLIQTRTFHDL